MSGELSIGSYFGPLPHSKHSCPDEIFLDIKAPSLRKDALLRTLTAARTAMVDIWLTINLLEVEKKFPQVSGYLS